MDVVLAAAEVEEEVGVALSRVLLADVEVVSLPVSSEVVSVPSLLEPLADPPVPPMAGAALAKPPLDFSLPRIPACLACRGTDSM